MAEQKNKKLTRKQIKRQRKRDANLRMRNMNAQMDKRHEAVKSQRDRDAQLRAKSKKYRERTAPKPTKQSTELSAELIARREKKKRKLKRRLMAFGMVFVLIVLGVTGYFLAENFMLSGIEVVGESRYNADELIAASGIVAGDRLAYVPYFSAPKAILEEYIYLSEAKIKFVFPDKLVLEVTPQEIEYHIAYNNMFYAVSVDGKVLGYKDSYSSGFDVPTVAALIKEPIIGEQIEYLVEDDNKIRLDIFREIQYNDILEGDIVVNILNTLKIELYYTDSFKIELGTQIDLSEKFNMVNKTITQHLEGERGVIDATDYMSVSFKTAKEVAFDFKEVPIYVEPVVE